MFQEKTHCCVFVSAVTFLKMLNYMEKTNAMKNCSFTVDLVGDVSFNNETTYVPENIMLHTLTVVSTRTFEWTENQV